MRSTTVTNENTLSKKATFKVTHVLTMYQIFDVSILYSPNPSKGGTTIVRVMPQTFQIRGEDQKLL